MTILMHERRHEGDNGPHKESKGWCRGYGPVGSFEFLPQTVHLSMARRFLPPLAMPPHVASAPLVAGAGAGTGAGSDARGSVGGPPASTLIEDPTAAQAGRVDTLSQRFPAGRAPLPALPVVADSKPSAAIHAPASMPSQGSSDDRAIAADQPVARPLAGPFLASSSGPAPVRARRHVAQQLHACRRVLWLLDVHCIVEMGCMGAHAACDAAFSTQQGCVHNSLCTHTHTLRSVCWPAPFATQKVQRSRRAVDALVAAEQCRARDAPYQPIYRQCVLHGALRVCACSRQSVTHADRCRKGWCFSRWAWGVSPPPGHHSRGTIPLPCPLPSRDECWWTFSCICIPVSRGRKCANSAPWHCVTQCAKTSVPCFFVCFSIRLAATAGVLSVRLHQPAEHNAM